MEKFDKRFDLLYDYFMKRLKNPKDREAMQKARTLWRESKKLILQPPTKERVLTLEKNFNEIIQLLATPKKLKTKKSFQAVGKTGGLCRDPLYMANLYLMHLWGIELPDYDNG